MYLISMELLCMQKMTLIVTLMEGHLLFTSISRQTNRKKSNMMANVTLYSKIKKSIVMAYCGTLFVGHSSSPDLLSHFYKFFGENHPNKCKAISELKNGCSKHLT